MLSPNSPLEYPCKPEVKGALPNRLFFILVPLVLLACVALVIVWTNSTRIMCWLSNCSYNPSGPSVAWSEQIALAQSEAAKVDKDAVLDYLLVSPVASWPINWNYTKTLELSFHFLRSTGDSFTISFYDHDPAGTWDIRHDSAEEDRRGYYRDSFALKQSRQRAESAALAEVRLSPREAVVATWREALEEASRDNITHISPLISLRLAAQPVWSVTYYPVPEKPPSIMERLMAALSLNYSSSFEVDAATGEILSRESESGLQREQSPRFIPTLPPFPEP